MPVEKFEAAIGECEYFRDMEITKGEEEEANKCGRRKPFMTELNLIR